MNKTWPTLFQKTNTGAIQQWTISVAEYEGSGGQGTGGGITTEHGQVGGKLQKTFDLVKEGKNPGKTNATTAYQQAEKEAAAKWTKQKKKGYVESYAAAQLDQVDETVIKGGIEPMLAPSDIYPKFAKDIKFPCYEQPKLDGNRQLAVVVDGKCTLWTRTRKQIFSVPHIVAAIEEKFAGKTLTFDGELYNHDYRDNFEDLMSLIRPPQPVPGHEVVQYWIYDLPSCKETFGPRHRALFALLHDLPQGSPLIMVSTTVCEDDAAIWRAHDRNLANEFEGTMVRNDGPYEEGRRSRHLQKLKTWKDGEFEIVGSFEGRGKDAGTIGAFECKAENGSLFKARLKATYDRRRELFGKKDFIGKMLTVKYQNLTGDGIPRFPIGKAIRDYE